MNIYDIHHKMICTMTDMEVLSDTPDVLIQASTRYKQDAEQMPGYYRSVYAPRRDKRGNIWTQHVAPRYRIMIDPLLDLSDEPLRITVS